MKLRKKRKICVVTGTRAEYGLLYPVMRAIKKHPALELSVIATGMHLMREFGYTVKEIEKDGFKIKHKVPIYLNSDDPAGVVKSVGLGIKRITEALQKVAVDIVVILGDRGEALATAISAAFLGIPLAHIHGGDKSGGACIDEPIRHAISRFAHLHFPAIKSHKERLIRMGEEPWRIHVAGPLGIYAMLTDDFIPKEKICKDLGLNINEPILVVIQHPVTVIKDDIAVEMKEIMDALVVLKKQAVVIYPNADTGSRKAIKVIQKYKKYPFIKTFRSLPYLKFMSLLRIADVMIGNSSSSVVEAPFFSLPALNLGARQESREKAGNLINIKPVKSNIITAVNKVLSDKGFRNRIKRLANPYATKAGGASKIAESLHKTVLGDKLLQKEITY